MATKNEIMYVRVEDDVADLFDERSASSGKTRSEALRELVTAYAERRVQVTPKDPDLYATKEN